MNIALPETLRHDTAPAWLNQVQRAIASGQTTVIDASGLRSFDSSVLACLIEVKRQVAAVGGQCQIAGMPERLQRLAQVYGLADLI